jgi:hypothetical protein
MKNLGLLIISIFFAFALSFATDGCSGGGGGSGGDSGPTYSGLTAPAAVDEANAEDLAGGAFATGLVTDGMMAFSAQQAPPAYHIANFRTATIPLTLRDSLDLVDIESLAPRGGQANVQTASDTIDGDCGGTMYYNVTGDDVQGSFSGRFRFSNYCNGGTIINGSASFYGEYDVNTGEFAEATFSFNNLTGGELSLTGDIHIDFAADPNVATFNAYGQDPGTGKVFWIKDYIITIGEFAGGLEIGMAGSFYHPDYGYVTLTTQDSFVVNDGDDWPSSGILVIAGANGSQARLTALDNATCRIEADAGGDDVYEWDSGIMNWEDL